MRALLTAMVALLTLQVFAKLPSIEDKTENMQAYEGYFDFYWDDSTGKIWLEIDRFDEEFLYVNSLPAGVGSNDIGLDRNQLGNSRVVLFQRIGPKVLLVQPNYEYRAVSDNYEERKSVEEAFARSVLAGFKVEAATADRVLVDITSMLLSDAHGVVDRLKSRDQGSYKLDKDRSALYLERTRNFPQNSEFEATITFAGDAKGGYLRSVTPSSSAITVRMHHSFVQLPDDAYQKRIYDPRSGYGSISYQDYATPIDQPLMKRFIRRHRLVKKDPDAAMSEAVEPIVYYLDRGTPEPIRSALIEGASWWNQAFEAAGFKNAFQVKVLPEGADPMDVRYNVINWVHRSTRGWSYGSSVTDPRTGEIIKGHVLLGSLRVRQDFLIAQGLIDAYEQGKEPDPRMLEMALARLRQLSAHEVGHTLGLSHNFAASTDQRASVMDYPHPLIKLQDDGSLSFAAAYDVNIGQWDKQAIKYGYTQFEDAEAERKGLRSILAENQDMGLDYISDQDARPQYGAHPLAHLWDNGTSAVEELKRLSELRETALASFDELNIPLGSPMADLERVLVPLYLSHRYQVEAVSKLIGGVQYNYAVRGDAQVTNTPVNPEVQAAARKALISTLRAGFLDLPQDLIESIPPQPAGYYRDRELFKIHTGLTFDPLGAAESAAHHTLTFLLNPQRLTRVVEQHARYPDRYPNAQELLRELFTSLEVDKNASAYHQELQRMVEKLAYQHLLKLAGDRKINQQVSAHALSVVRELDEQARQAYRSDELTAHYQYLDEQIRRFLEDPERYELPAMPAMPDGSPIGCGE